MVFYSSGRSDATFDSQSHRTKETTRSGTRKNTCSEFISGEMAGRTARYRSSLNLSNGEQGHRLLLPLYAAHLNIIVSSPFVEEWSLETVKVILLTLGSSRLHLTPRLSLWDDSCQSESNLIIIFWVLATHPPPTASPLDCAPS